MLFRSYLFGTELTDFALVKEFIIQKVSLPNRKILLFDNNEEENSVYPMIDEFGYAVKDHFMFKSTWDTKYYLLAANRGSRIRRYNRGRRR